MQSKMTSNRRKCIQREHGGSSAKSEEKTTCVLQLQILSSINHDIYFDFCGQAAATWNSDCGRRRFGHPCLVTLCVCAHACVCVCVCFCMLSPSLMLHENPNRSETSVREILGLYMLFVLLLEILSFRTAFKHLPTNSPKTFPQTF